MKPQIRLVMVAISLSVALTGWATGQEADQNPAALWAGSPHADATSESFVHWDEEGEVPGNCAVCHSGIGFRDFLGADGSAAGSIDSPVPTGSVVDCETCHNPVAESLAEILFPSGILMTEIGRDAPCLVCHQGRESTFSVDEAVAGLEPDAVVPDLGFINVHYGVAAATTLGSEVSGAYEYEGKSYTGAFAHVPPFSTCTDCHDAHSTRVELQQCTGCHQVETLADIRLSPVDFDGDGDTSEGIAAEIAAMNARLGDAIASYAAEVAGAEILYALRYPYWFNDTNGDGEAQDEELAVPNRFQSWTPRLLRAAYNFHYVREDPGAYAHNPHYVLQVMFDSIENLAEIVDLDMAGLTRP